MPAEPIILDAARIRIFNRSAGLMFAILCGFLLLFTSSAAFAQQQNIPRRDTTRTPVSRQGRGGPPGGQAGSPSGNQVQFQAKDSLVFDFSGQREGTLYGAANVSHSSGQLTAGKVQLNLDKHTVSAETETPGDTLSQPVLQREQDKIRSESIRFNYVSKKGKFHVARVKIQQGKLTGTEVKNTSPHVVYIRDGIYSTCTLDHPHYYIKAAKMKVVDQDEIFFTKARLYLLDIPYPLVFPFGYVPAKIEKHRSGILEPTYAYQQQQTRGIGLQNLGWFQYFNDYLTGRVSFDIFTSGTFLGNMQLDYRKRGKYSGSVNIGYSRERGLEKTDPSFNTIVNKKISVRHNQDFSPYASLNANIELRTQDYYRRNSYNIDERAEVSTNSGMSYKYRDPGDAYNFSISAQHNQNFNTQRTSLSGPRMNFSLRSFSPFQSNGGSRGADTRWYENINISYSNQLQTRYQFTPKNDSVGINWFDALLNREKYRRATGNDDYIQTGFRHDASINAGNLLSNPHLNMSASISMNEYWYLQTIRQHFDPDTNRVVTEKVPGFASARDFTTSLNMNTRIYGIWNQRIGNLVAFRHTVTPSISFSYRPDFSNDFWGYYRTVQTDTAGHTRRYSIFQEGIMGGPSSGEVRAISFNLGNVFEAKQVRRDTTGEKRENNLRLIDRLDFSTSYNFAADSVRLSDLNVSFSSRLIEGLNLSANATYRFYKLNENGIKTNQFLIEDSNRLMQLDRFSLSASTQFSGGGGRGLQAQSGPPPFPRHYDPFNQSLFHQYDAAFNRRPIEPLKSPWSLSLRFSYSWNYRHNQAPRKSATLNASSIQFRLTPKWNFNTTLGYDFIKKELTPTQFSLNRQLHLWNLSFQMNPFGDFQYYMFSLRLNDAQLQSLFQKLPLLKNLERSSSPINRSGRRY